MLIDSNIVDHYLNQDSVNTYSHSLIFHEIEPGRYLFESPSENLIPKVSLIRKNVVEMLEHFQPYNQKIWNILFPEWKIGLENVTVHLVVGCPAPYEAMIRMDSDHHEQIIFDLILFARYKMSHIQSFVRAMLTHEGSHILLHQNYPANKATTFNEKMRYLLFDEGLAHFLAKDEEVGRLNWESDQNRCRRLQAFFSFNKACKVTDKEEQHYLIHKAEAGTYWSKFACITGMFQWAACYKRGIGEVKRAYNSGWKKFILSNW